MGLDGVELIMSIEAAFDLQIPQASAEKLLTVGQLHAHVVNELQQKGRPCEPNAVFENIRRLISRQLDVAPARILPSTRFIQDLRLS